MSDKIFDYRNVSFETENIGNGTILRCIGAGDDVELVSTWFAREQDAELWKAFLEGAANAVVHSIDFNADQRDALISERDALRHECSELSAKLDLVKESINEMFNVISIDDVSLVGHVEQSSTLDDFIDQLSVINFDSLSFVDKARFCKIMGYTQIEADKVAEHNLYYVLRELGTSFSNLCTENDVDFIETFGKPLFDANSYMSSGIRNHVQNIVSYLLDEKLRMIRNDAESLSIFDIAAELKVHPAYIWAVCIEKKIPHFFE